MPDPSNPPGERRLAHPPSDRYRLAAVPAPQGDAATSGPRGLALGLSAGLAGAVAIVVLGGSLTMTAGLVIVAAATGWVVGALLPGRSRTAVVVALAAVVIGQLGLWAYAQSQGGVLGPLDLLWQVYGGLVPIELLAAAILAWVGAR
jgi:hypothetical protein